jgi:hypothetical protein
MSAIDSDALKEYIKKTDLTAVERGALLQAISNMPTLTPQNEWVSVEERLPELPEKDWCSKMVISCDKNGHVAPMIWERAQVRWKMIERWKYHWDRIYDGAGITHWMPLPAPPGEGNNVPNEPPNEPLTWNELGNMVEKPVYIVELEDGESCWVLVHTVDDIKALFVSAFDQYDYGNRELYGQTWLAYRRLPEVSP